MAVTMIYDHEGSDTKKLYNHIWVKWLPKRAYLVLSLLSALYASALDGVLLVHGHSLAARF